MATKKPAYEAPAQATDKKKALETALRQIEKSFGKGAVMRMGDRPALNIEAIPTGSLALDAALGVGGFVVENEEDFRDFLENNRQYWDYVDEELDPLCVFLGMVLLLVKLQKFRFLMFQQTFGQ